MKKTAIGVLLVAASAIPVLAQEVKPENQIKYRRAAYQLMNLNFTNLDNMSKDKKPFNAALTTRSSSPSAGNSARRLRNRLRHGFGHRLCRLLRGTTRLRRRCRSLFCGGSR